MGRFGEIDLAQKSLPWERGLYGTTLPSPTDPNKWVAKTPARTELAAVAMALQGTSRADDLAILIDSAAAIQRLRWFWSHDFRPAEHEVKDYDIIHDILRDLKLRSQSSSRTLFVNDVIDVY